MSVRMKTGVLVAAVALVMGAAGVLHVTAHASTSDERSIQGTAVTPEGKPISSVTVYGSLGSCCPSTRERTVTDAEGRFRLQHPGAVLHFNKPEFQPLVVVRPATGELHVTLRPAREELKLPECGKAARGLRRVGWGRYGLKFDVPQDQADVRIGKPDVDYVVALVKPKGGSSVLELWFGPNAFDPDPSDKDVIRSLKVTQRRVAGGAGMDTRGELAGQRRWRSLGVFGEGGAVYRDAGENDAKVLDRVIDALCLVPYPSK